MRRAIIAPMVTSLALGALTFFAVGGLVIGALQGFGAHRIAVATQSSERDMLIGGIGIFVIGGLLLWWTMKQWRAIVAIRVDDDGAWWLEPRAGAPVRVPASQPVALELHCRRVMYTFGAAPRLRDLVDGWVIAGDLRRRLALSGPRTYELVLDALGLEGGPPARGSRARYERRRAA